MTYRTGTIFIVAMLLCNAILIAAPTLRYKPGIRPLDFRRIQWPETAPREANELKTLRFPDPAVCCDLDVKNVRAGTYRGPDGARVHVRPGGSWIWYRSDGARIWSSKKSMMRLSRGKHRVTSYRLTGRRAEFNRRSLWKFPDGTVLRRFYVEKFKRYAYTFADEKKGYSTVSLRREAFCHRSNVLVYSSFILNPAMSISSMLSMNHRREKNSFTSCAKI